MAKFELPDSVFDVEIPQGSIDKAVKAAGAKTVTEAAGKMFQVPIENIRLIPGFNIRVPTKEYEKHVAGLADLIAANGYDNAKPLSAYAGKEGDEHVVYLTDGHSRLSAVNQLNTSERASIATLPVVVKAQTTTREDMAISLFTANEGRSLSTFEVALLVKRLMGYNMPKEEIARRLGKTERMIENYVIISGFPAAIRDMLIADQISATQALSTFKKHGKDAAKILKDAIAAAQEAGKEKASGKHVAKAKTDSSGDGEGDETGPIQITDEVVKGKAVQKRTYKFTAFDSPSYADIREIRTLDGGKWWSREEGSDEVTITSDIEITIVIKKPAAEAVEPVAAPAEETGEGEAENTETSSAAEGEGDADSPSEATAEGESEEL